MTRGLIRRLFVFFVLAFAAPLTAQAPTDSLIVDVAGKRTVLHSLAGLPRDTVTGSFHDAGPKPYSGVDLRQLLEHNGLDTGGRMRGKTLAQYFIVEARDGYRVSFGLAELDAELVSHRMVLVDSLDGHPLPANEGPWRLIVAGDGHGARSVRMVSAIRVREP